MKDQGTSNPIHIYVTSVVSRIEALWTTKFWMTIVTNLSH